MDTLAKRIQFLANVATIVVAVALTVVLVEGHVARPPRMPVVKGISPGWKVPLAGVDWEGNSHTLVLALAQGCHFCAESAPFYQRLLRQLPPDKRLAVLAVFPEGSTRNEQYLANHGLEIREVRQTSFASLGIAGTPTLLLVDRKGIAREVWVGKLPPEKEEQVLKSIQQ